MSDKDDKDDEDEPAPIGDAVDDWMESVGDKLKLVDDGLTEDERHRLEADRAIAAEQELKLRQIRSLVTRGIPVRQAQRLLLGTVELSQAVVTVNQWRQRAVRGAVLVLAGLPSSGKTLAAVKAVVDGPPLDYLGRDWDPSQDPRFVDVSVLHGMGLYDRTGAFRQLTEASVLAIDDLGCEYEDEKGAMRSLVDRLFDARYRGPGWTVMTTNLSGTDFAKRYGDRIMARLHDEGCGFKWVQGNYRQKETSK